MKRLLCAFVILHSAFVIPAAHAQRALQLNPNTRLLIEGFGSGANTIKITATGTLEFVSGFTLTGGSHLKTALSLNNVENTALSTWAGASSITTIGTLSAGAVPTTLLTGTITNTQLAGSIAASKLVGTDITTLGTITTGTWQGSIIAPAYLGTGSSISTKYLRGDGTWQTIAGGGDALTTNPLSQFAATTSAQLRGVLSDESGTGEFLTTNGSAAALTSFPTLNQNTTGTAAGLSATLAIASGGTGSTTASDARTALGLGTAAVLDASAAGNATANALVKLDASGVLISTNGLFAQDVSNPTRTSQLVHNGLAFFNVAGSGFYHYIALTTPTADRTHTLPDVSGTIITSGNLSSITATGTITSGTWQGSAIAIANGGTGSTTASGARTAMGLAIGTDIHGWSPALASLVSASGNPADYVITLNGLGHYLAAESLPVRSGGTESTTASGARTNLGLAIGTNVQAYDADLTTYAGITPSANVQSLLGAANYAGMRTLLDLEPNVDYVAYDFTIASILSVIGSQPSGSIPYANGVGNASHVVAGAAALTWLEEATTMSSARVSLGVAPGVHVQAFDPDLTTYAGITPSANVQSYLGAADYAAMKTQLSLGSVENTALSTWAGSTNLTTLGTITTGTWSGTALVGTKVDAATTSARGTVELATDGETSASVVVQGNDTRLANANKVEIGIAVSDETSDNTASTTTPKVSFRMPYAMTLTGLRCSLTKAATGAVLTVDLHEAGSTIMTTNKLTVDASELTSTTAATAAGITDSALADDALIEVFIDVVGTTTDNTGEGVKIWLIGTR